MDLHDSNRQKICIVCAKKSESVIQPGSNLAKLVEEFVVADYNTLDNRLPQGLCSTCRRTLNDYGAGKFDRCLPQFYDFTCMNGFLKARNGVCACLICQMAPVRGKFGAKSSRNRPQVSPKS